MEEYEFRFSPMSQSDTGAFKLSELPPDLCKLVETLIESLEKPQFVIVTQMQAVPMTDTRR